MGVSKKEYDPGPLDHEDELYFLWSIYNLQRSGVAKISVASISAEFGRLKAGKAATVPQIIKSSPLKGTLYRFIQSFYDQGYICCENYQEHSPNVPKFAREILQDVQRVYAIGDAHSDHTVLSDTGRMILERVFKKNDIDPEAHLPPETLYARFR